MPPHSRRRRTDQLRCRFSSFCLKKGTLLRLWEKRFRQHFFFCLIWNHAATCRKAKLEVVRLGGGISGTAQGQIVYRRSRLPTGALTTPKYCRPWTFEQYCLTNCQRRPPPTYSFRVVPVGASVPRLPLRVSAPAHGGYKS